MIKEIIRIAFPESSGGKLLCLLMGETLYINTDISEDKQHEYIDETAKRSVDLSPEATGLYCSIFGG